MNLMRILIKQLSLIMLLITLSPITLAAEDNAYLLTEKTWKALTDINALIDEGNAADAVPKLQSLLPDVQSNAYDLAVTQQTLGYAHNRLQNYNEAITAFSAALNTNALPFDVSHQVRFSLAQLLIYTEQYVPGLKQLERWLKNESSPGLDASLLAGSAYYETGQFDRAITHAKKVIQLKTAYDESWYQLLLSAYFKTSQYQNAANLLEKMIRIQPENKTYWQQLTGAWQNAGNDQKTLATLTLMHKRDLLNAEEIKQLINMYLYLDMPYKAGELLDQEIKRGRLQADNKTLEWMGDIWLQANERERASKTLSSIAASEGNADLYARVGQIYFDIQDYPNTIEHLQKAVQIGGLEQSSKSYLLLGIAAFNTANYKLAESALTQASVASSTRDQADWWLQRLSDHLDDQTAEKSNITH